MTQKEVIYELIKTDQPVPTAIIRQKTDMRYMAVTRCLADLGHSDKIKGTWDGWVAVETK